MSARSAASHARLTRATEPNFHEVFLLEEHSIKDHGVKQFDPMNVEEIQYNVHIPGFHKNETDTSDIMSIAE